MAGAFGAALIFFTLMIAEILFGLLFLMYAAHCFLVAMQDTAAGNDEVVWPDEPMFDWLHKGVYLSCIVAIWLAPLGILARILRAQGAEGSLFWPLAIAALAMLWIMFPISLLSALSGNSRWILLRFTVIKELTRVAGSMLTVYMASGILLAGCLGLTFLAIVQGVFWLLPVAALAVAWSILVYGRLLGRIAWLIGRQKPAKRKKTETRPVMPQGFEAESSDPWKTPAGTNQPKKKKKSPAPAAGPRPTLPVEGYALSPEAPPPRPQMTPLDGFAPVGYETIPMQSGPANDPAKDKGWHTVPEPSELDMQLAMRSKPAAPPAWPLVTGVYNFPWYPSTLSAWLTLSLGSLIVGGLCCLMRSFFPY